MTNLLDKFGLSGDLFSSFADTPEIFESTGRTTTLHMGRRVAFNASINGTPVDAAYATLHSATLSRMSVIEQKSPNTGDMYKIVTGIFNPVQMTIEVVIDGETMTLPELLRAYVNSTATKPISEQMFLDTANRIGLKFAEGMPLLWQQFGASEAGIDHAFSAFEAAGAVDAFPSMKEKGKTGNIIKAYAHATGVPVTSFEIGTVNREQSKTGQGFLNLVDASMDQFQRIVSLRKEASILKAELTAQTSWSQNKVQKANDRIKELNNMSRQWTTNWAGAQQVIRIDAGGNRVMEQQYAAVNAPCGRFNMVVDSSNVAVDLWKNSARAENLSTAPASASVVESDSDGEELPF